MKRYILTACSMLLASAASAQVPVIDNANFKIAKETSVTTDKILNTNKDILTTVTDTLKAVTGDRGSESGQMQNLAVGNGFSVASMPSFDS
ncbi:MAG: conjugal transfer protein, partial [Mesorhizobium sp.]